MKNKESIELIELKEQFNDFWVNQIVADHCSKIDFDLAWAAYQAGYKQAVDDYIKISDSVII